MKLDVLNNSESVWYSAGLNFTCTQCGNCCSGGPGYVWITDEEIAKLAIALKLSVRQTIHRYCRRIGERYSLKEHRNAAGMYDCVFLKEVPAEPAANQPQDRISQPKRACSIYDVRPLQCRTWPFWGPNLETPQAWEHASERCPGINPQGRKFTRKQIQSIRDAAEWPKDPPSSR